jgi:hypothetical protein
MKSAELHYGVNYGQEHLTRSTKTKKEAADDISSIHACSNGIRIAR